MTTIATDAKPRRPLISYQSVWRWHFYAGLFCVPFVILLAITGSIYLFKPQVEAWLDRPYDGLAVSGASAGAEAQVNAALATVPGSSLRSYEVREHSNDAARVIVGTNTGDVRIYVHPQSLAVLKVQREDARPMEVLKTIHGELLLGDKGSILVELAASWAIVMILTGLYLWWPRRGRGVAGIVYPRLRAGGRVFWRDLHALTGIWVSAFALFLLLTALPWTNVWGAAFKEARTFTGTAVARQDWSQSRRAEHDQHAGHGSDAPRGMGTSLLEQHRGGASSAAVSSASLDAMVARIRSLDLAPPVLIAPPAAKSGWNTSTNWTARSDAQNRPLRVTLTLDPATGAVLRREDFGSEHLIDRIVGYGIAAHEGQLFGWINQLLGVLTALGLITLSVTGYVMWWRRRPEGRLGAPPAPAEPRMAFGVAIAIVALGLFLPVLGASMLFLALIERLLLSRIAVVRNWLGLHNGSGMAQT